ncbi:MAG TPA: low-specificity L-threonine aldolase [Desulfobacteraceae bacterium]|nr:low-specificity L-threonine aldolase [Desulfobacteraceae bacterium]
MKANSLADLRSDTVTRPTLEMKSAMMDAPLGDDVYGEDPTVNRLEEKAAHLTGKKAALYCSSGTQSNLLALLSHCQRGDEYIVGQTAHTYRYEAGGAAVLGSIQPQPLDFEPDGTLDLSKVARFIKPDDYHFAKTRLLCLENTQGGKILSMGYLKQARAFADTHGLGFHLDGARVFNAAVALNVDIKEITGLFDTVSCCLSKGLGAPVGSVLCGPADFIARARRWRKMVGGGMRQAGILAAACIYALDNNVDRLAEDHANAKRLAEGLSGIEELNIHPEDVQTNILFATVGDKIDALADHMEKYGICIDRAQHLRLVTHLDITAEDIENTIQGFRDFYQKA